MPTRPWRRGGRQVGYRYHGRRWTFRQWRAKHVTGNFARAPRRRRGR